MEKAKIFAVLICVALSVLSLAGVEIYFSSVGILFFRGGVTLDFGSFYASLGMGYIPPLSISMGESYSAEFRAGGQLNYTGLKNTLFVPFTFDLSIETGIIVENYLFLSKGYSASVSAECLAQIFPFENFRGGITLGVVAPIFSVTYYEEKFLLTFTPVPLLVPEVGVVIGF